MKISMKQNMTIWAGILAAFFTFYMSSCTPGKAEKAPGAPDKDLHTAVLTDDLEAVKQHIAAGSDLNVKEPFGGSTPLISAIVFDKSEAAELLISAGANLNTTNNDGSTAVHVAAFFCRPQLLKTLLAKGADKTIRNNFGATAYESVAGSYTDVEGIYKMMGEQLAPMGLRLDYSYIENTRPVVAEMLKD